VKIKFCDNIRDWKQSKATHYTRLTFLGRYGTPAPLAPFPKSLKSLFRKLQLAVTFEVPIITKKTLKNKQL